MHDEIFNSLPVLARKIIDKIGGGALHPVRLRRSGGHHVCCACGAPQEVTISQSNLRKFNEALEKGTPSLLSGAFCDMIAQLSRELVPQFMRFRHQARTAAERTAETPPTALAA